jgi:hypothetical protein
VSDVVAGSLLGRSQLVVTGGQVRLSSTYGDADQTFYDWKRRRLNYTGPRQQRSWQGNRWVNYFDCPVEPICHQIWYEFGRKQFPAGYSPTPEALSVCFLEVGSIDNHVYRLGLTDYLIADLKVIQGRLRARYGLETVLDRRVPHETHDLVFPGEHSMAFRQLIGPTLEQIKDGMRQRNRNKKSVGS